MIQPNDENAVSLGHLCIAACLTYEVAAGGCRSAAPAAPGASPPQARRTVAIGLGVSNWVAARLPATAPST